MLKTSVMMIGEFEFDDLFFDNVYDTYENVNGHEKLPYKVFTMIFFLVFMIIMPIIIMNLLVRIEYNILFSWIMSKLGRVAQRITRLTTDQKIAGSNPAWIEKFFFPFTVPDQFKRAIVRYRLIGIKI